MDTGWQMQVGHGEHSRLATGVPQLQPDVKMESALSGHVDHQDKQLESFQVCHTV